MPETQPPSLRRRTLKSLLAEPHTPRKGLLGNWLTERHMNLTWAPTGVGKTLFAGTVAIAVSGGGSAFGWTAPSSSRVLYVDGEMDLTDLQERASMLLAATEGADPTEAKDNLMFIARHDQAPEVIFPDLGTESGQKQLCEEVENFKPGLVILDNLSTLATLEDENSAEAFNPIIQLMNRIRLLGAAVMLIHHSRKDGKALRGSSKINAVFESIISLRDQRLGGIGHAAFEVVWQKIRQSPDVVGQPVRASLKDNTWTLEEASSPQIDELCLLIRSGEFSSQTELAKHMDLAKQRVTDLKKEAIRRGRITSEEFAKCLKAARSISDAETSAYELNPDF